ncbi:MAG: hypothetical protein AAF677_11655 [Pseudomonadota bacterium]
MALRVGWLELNAQRAASATGFYRDLFVWHVTPMALAPWGVLPVFRSGVGLAAGGRSTATGGAEDAGRQDVGDAARQDVRDAARQDVGDAARQDVGDATRQDAGEGVADAPFGLAFSAMGAFAPPRWLPSLIGDPERAILHAEAVGGRSEGAIQDIPGFGRLASLRDPTGALVHIADLQRRPAPGGPVVGAGLWGPGVTDAARFYARLLDLEPVVMWTAEATPTAPLGTVVALIETDGTASLWLHDVGYEVAPPRWVPYFRSASPGGDGRRAEVLGAIPQVPVIQAPGDAATGPGPGTLGIWNDPAGAAFGLCLPPPPQLSPSPPAPPPATPPATPPAPPSPFPPPFPPPPSGPSDDA